MGRDPHQAAEAALLEELQALYRSADDLFAGARCEASTECCRFGITGREPQVTSLEVALLRRAVRARGGMLPAKRRALPLLEASLGPARGADERTCPLLDQNGRCSAYAARPLGCRTFFCQRADVPRKPGRAELQGLVRTLQGLAARHRQEGDKPRALTSAVRDF
jgi:Fe-S-cluster containining protein